MKSFRSVKMLLAVSAFCGLLLLGGCGSGGVSADDGAVKGPSITLNTQKGKTVIEVEIADTMEDRTKGLMYRKSIPENFGMFFIFDEEAEHDFWMKNTLIPLDMIFFDRNYKVVKIVHNAQPCKKDPCMVYSTDKVSKYVLEVNAGLGDKIGLKEGDSAELKI
jgi:uncharacterized membrane protein (UPF0127 family)